MIWGWSESSGSVFEVLFKNTSQDREISEERNEDPELATIVRHCPAVFRDGTGKYMGVGGKQNKKWGRRD